MIAVVHSINIKVDFVELTIVPAKLISEKQRKWTKL